MKRHKRYGRGITVTQEMMQKMPDMLLARIQWALTEPVRRVIAGERKRTATIIWHLPERYIEVGAMYGAEQWIRVVDFTYPRRKVYALRGQVLFGERAEFAEVWRLAGCG